MSFYKGIATFSGVRGPEFFSLPELLYDFTKVVGFDLMPSLFTASLSRETSFACGQI